MIIGTLDDPFYYLVNFRAVLAWVGERYDDVLSADERAFLLTFVTLPQPAQALLVRMIMRRGTLFRAGKLAYREIGSTAQATAPLCALGWVDADPELSLEQLFGLLTKGELVAAFKPWVLSSNLSKTALFETVKQEFGAARRTLGAWCHGIGEDVYAITIMPLCERLRLLFFGNLHQDWSEFVLAELGVYRYESVDFSRSSRAFRTRDDVDLYLEIHRCRERFEQGASVTEIMAELPAPVADNAWLESRRAKLLFVMARHCERTGELPMALQLYAQSAHPEARGRRLRVLELSGDYAQALELAQQAVLAPQSEAEEQHLQRIMPRLQRKLGIARGGAKRARPHSVERIDLALPRSVEHACVELAVRDHLNEEGGPVYYVENTLIVSLFGLLCWEAIFAALPGAFFHPFQAGPADLLRPEFEHRRTALFDACLAQLDSPHYQATIRRHYAAKWGLQSPFVHWGVLTQTLLDQALLCLPAGHLKLWFRRILSDIKANRAGLPDLIQLWPEQARYRMVEVKGPGDRLQDNQRRWLDFFAEHDMPVAVCYVQWQAETAS